MAYNQKLLDQYRADAKANRPFVCTTCPYCNGERDATPKHIHPSTKPASPWDFWRHVLLDKYRRVQSSKATENLAVRLPHTAPSSSNAEDCLEPLSEERHFVVGPMVDQSELPFRMLCREYGSTLAYTPMLHARSFSEGASYRRRFFTTTPLDEVRDRMAAKQSHCEDDTLLVDRPVIVQFCGHEPDTVLDAARFAVRGEYRDASSTTAVRDSPTDSSEEEFLFHCDAVDLNLGCPQGIARRGHYGSFLMEDWDLIHTIIHTLHVELEVPVTVKIRVFDDHVTSPDEPTAYDELLTIQYARMIRDAGAQLLCVHGRTREMKGQQTGLANMDLIRTVRSALAGSIPVIANGNVQYYKDVLSHLEHTRCEGHMCAEPLLWDPALFSNPQHPVLSGRTHGADKSTRLSALRTAMAYVRWLRRFPVDLGFAKAHLFKMCYHSYELHTTFREFMSTLKTSGAAAEAEAASKQIIQTSSECVCAPTEVDDEADMDVGVFESNVLALERHLQEVYDAEVSCNVEGEQPKSAKEEKAAAKALRVDVFEEEGDLGINF